MDRQRESGFQPFARGVGGILRVHDEMATDRDQDQVGFVVLADQLHVPEQAGVAHVVDPEPVLQFDDESDRLAAVPRDQQRIASVPKPGRRTRFRVGLMKIERLVVDRGHNLAEQFPHQGGDDGRVIRLSLRNLNGHRQLMNSSNSA